LHVLGYGVFALALAYATLDAGRTRRRLLFVVGAAMTLGLGLELVQSTLPYRTFSYADMAANALGALVGLLWMAVESRVEYVPLGFPGGE
jgi:VanZ family protein